MKRVLYILMGTLLYSTSSLAMDLASFRALVIDFSQNQITRKQLIDAYEQIETAEDRGIADLMIDEAHLKSIIQLKEQEGSVATFNTLVGLYKNNQLPQQYLLKAYERLATPEDRRVADQTLRTQLTITIDELRQNTPSQGPRAPQVQREQQPIAATQTPAQREQLPSVTPQSVAQREEPSRRVSHYTQIAATPQSVQTPSSQIGTVPSRWITVPPVKGHRTQHHLEAAYEKKQRQKALLANLEQQARVQEATFAETTRRAQEQIDRARSEEAAATTLQRAAPQQAHPALTQASASSTATAGSTTQVAPPYSSPAQFPSSSTGQPTPKERTARLRLETEAAAQRQSQPISRPSIRPFGTGQSASASPTTTSQEQTARQIQEAQRITAGRESQRRAQIAELLAEQPTAERSVPAPATSLPSTTTQTVKEEAQAPTPEVSRAELLRKMREGLARKQAIEAQHQQLEPENVSKAGTQRAPQSVRPEPVVIPPVAQEAPLSVSWSMLGNRPLFKEGTHPISPDPASFIVEFDKKSQETIVRWGELLAEEISNKIRWKKAMIYLNTVSELPGAPKEKLALLIKTTNEKIAERDRSILD